MSRISKLLVFTGCALAVGASALAQEMTQSFAKVVRIKGSARYADVGNVWQPLKVGDELPVGSIVQTAADSRVDLVLGEKHAVANEVKWDDVVSSGGGVGYQPTAQQDFVRIWENSVMAIEKLMISDTGTDQIRETSLDLRAGRIFGMVKKLNGASKYEVKFPNAVAGIRGTIYTIGSGGVVDVLVGSVVVAYKNAQGGIVTQMVMGGQRFDASTGQMTLLPEGDQAEMTHCWQQNWPHVPPHWFGHDHTHHWVSPTTGHHGPPGPPPGPPPS